MVSFAGWPEDFIISCMIAKAPDVDSLETAS